MIKHRTFIFVIASLLASVFMVSSAMAQRGIVPVPIKDKAGNQVLLYQESHALLVGVSEYTKGWPNLPGVRKDINEVKVALEKKGFHAVVVINPTRVELRDSIENFINLYGQDIDNRLIFYFAGHGHTMQSSYGEEMGYFVPADAPNPNTDKSGFLATSINMESIEVYSKKVQSKHALFLFDSCFSGSIFSLSRAIPENISYKTSKPVRQFITAGSADETVPDVSIFNDQLIRALSGEGDLDGDGYLTGVELGEFLNKTVINYSKGSQHPQYGKIRNPNLDKGDFVFSLLDTHAIENSIDVLAREREKLEQERFRIERERKRMEAAKRLENEREKLKEEQERLRIENKKLARLSPSSVPLHKDILEDFEGLKEMGSSLQPSLEKKQAEKPKDSEFDFVKELQRLGKWDGSPALTPDKNSDHYFNVAIFYQQSRNWEKALTNYSKAAELDASNPDIYNNIGVIYKELRQYDRAIEEFLTATQLNPDYAKPYNNIGVVYYAKKDFANAIRNYQKAVSIDPENLEALNNLAVAYKHIDQLEKSKAVLNQALKVNPDHAGTHYNRAVLYEEEGNLKSAIQFYQRFVNLGSTSHPTLSVQVKKHIESLEFLDFSKGAEEDLEVFFETGVSFTNLRDAPNTTTGNILFVLTQGTEVEILERKGKWSKIRTKPGSKEPIRTGWVGSALLNPGAR